MVRSLARARRIPRPIAILISALLVVFFLPLGAVSASAAGDADISVYDQCQIGNPVVPGDKCEQWTNGILNGTHNVYNEDEVTPQRLVVSFDQAGAHTVDLSYLTFDHGVHAYDSLATWNHTVSNADRCQNIGAAANCVGGVPTVFPIPPDTTAHHDVGVGRSATVANHQLTGQVLTLYGGALTGASYLGMGTYAPDYQTLRVSLTTVAPKTKVMLLFGGHIGATFGPRGWGETSGGKNLGAAQVPGGSYHIRVTNINGAAIGNRDNQLMSDAIAPPASTTIATNATAGPVAIGGSITDTATITPSTAAGTVTFKVYGPDDATCSGTATTLGPVTVSNGTATSPAFTPTAVGTYRWIASFTPTDQTQYNAVSGACNDANESSVIAKRQPAISTDAQDSATLPNAQIHDVATVTNLTPDAAGTVTFNLYGPNDTSCATSIWTNTKPLGTVTNGSATVQSDDRAVWSAGTYRWVASYSGDAKNNAIAGQCNDANESTLVNKANPTITTDASDTAKLPDATVSDTATLTGVTPNATGTITFRLYGPDPTPDTPTCDDTNLVFTSTEVKVGGPGTYGPVTTTVDKAGTYFWVASYSGDADNNGVTGVCGDPTETSSVDKASPLIATTASNAQLPGGTVKDTATLTGLTNDATGTVTFKLYGPSPSPLCIEANLVLTSTTSISAVTNHQATATSATYAPSTAGDYYWTAVYNGDDNNATAVSGCGAPDETSEVGKAKPAISTQATSTSLPGGTIHDVATVSGLTNDAQGSVTFELYGPSATPDCSGTAVSTSTVPLGSISSGTAVVTSGSYTPTVAGKYYWIASYSGDQNNLAVSGECGDTGETSTVDKASPAITTSATQSATLPTGTLKDSAHLTGLTSDATGTVVFRLYGPDATPGTPTCDAGLVYTSPLVPITNNGNGTADASTPAPGYLPTAAGTYFWIASYSGDDNNAAVFGKCGDDGETSTVRKARPEITTEATDDSLPSASIHDVATVTGLTSDATGTVTFKVYGPSATPDCDGAAVFSSTKPLGTVAGGKASVTSADFVPSRAGSYYWIASYSGDANNNTVAGSCGDEDETSEVDKAGPSISTQVDDETVTLTANGVSISDTATLSGATKGATGSISFTVYGPFEDREDISCDTDGTSAGTVAVEGNGSYDSESVTVHSAGYYTWLAAYSGDGNNDPATHACGLESETVLVQKAPTEVATVATEQAIIKLGQSISDSATVSGVTPNATGTVTFSLYGPDVEDCTGEPVFKSTNNLVVGQVDGKPVGTATSDEFTPTEPGVYRWVASYSGDGNNATSAGECNDPNEQSVVFAGDHPGLDKDADPAPGSVVQPGQQIDYTVTVSNTGDVAIKDAPVVDLLPEHVTVVEDSISDGGTYDAESHSITWHVTLGPDGSEEPPSSHTFTYSVTVDEDAPAGAVLRNTAKFQDLEDTTTHVVASGDIGIVKSVSPVVGNGVIVKFGDTLTYTLTVTTTGTLTQKDVVVTDYVPGFDPARPTSGSTTYVANSAACSGTCTIDQPGADGLITWHLGDMPGGTSRTVTFKVTIDRPAANPDGSIPAVEILNAGAVQVGAVKKPSNEVKTPVAEVLGVKQGRPPVAPLPRTGLGLAIGPVLGGSILLIGAGLALLAATRRREEGRHRA